MKRQQESRIAINVKPKPASPVESEPIPVTQSPSYFDIFDAIGQGDAEEVDLILENAYDVKELLTRKDLQGLTPLRKAIAMGQGLIARSLVTYGAKPSVTDPRGRTVLHLAATQGHRNLMAPLLVCDCSDVNVQDVDGWTPLHYAIRGKHDKLIDWLMFTGGNPHLKNKNDEDCLDMCDKQSPQYLTMSKYLYRDLECSPVHLVSTYLTRNNLCDFKADSTLMFVTSEQWAEQPQFMLNVRVNAMDLWPAVPLQEDEFFLGEAYHYRMLQRLAEGETRVKVYFTVFHRFENVDLVLKVTSKSKYLGEIKVTMSSFVHLNYTNSLACAEMDLYDEGQFVLCTRPRRYRLTRDENNVLSIKSHPDIQIDLPEDCFPPCPSDWNDTRRERALAETEELLKRIVPPHFQKETQSLLEVTEEGQEEAEGKKEEPQAEKTKDEEGLKDEEAKGEEGQDKSDNRTMRDNRNSNKVAEEVEEHHGDEAEDGDGEQEDTRLPYGKNPGDYLNGDEEDDVDCFFYISHGWGPWMEMRFQVPLDEIPEVSVPNESTIRAWTPFYRLQHTCGVHPSSLCTLQVPTTPLFEKTGTVLVFYREPIGPDEVVLPDPDPAEENFISEDGVNTRGQVWLNTEKERWKLLPTGIVNRRTRVVFQLDKLTSYIVIQLDHGEETWEKEDGESSSEEGSQAGMGDDGDDDEGDDGGGGEDGEASPAEDGEDGRRKKKKKRKTSKKSAVEEGDEDHGAKAKEGAEEKDKEAPSATGGAGGGPAGSPGASAAPSGTGGAANAPGSVTGDGGGGGGGGGGSPEPSSAPPTNEAQLAQEPEAPAPSPQPPEETGGNENASNSNKPEDYNNNAFLQYVRDAPTPESSEENLPPEERTVYMGPPVVEVPFTNVIRMDVRQEAPDPTPSTSEEFTGPDKKKLSISVQGGQNLENFTYGPPLTSLDIQDTELAQLQLEIAYMWKFRNHQRTVLMAMSKVLPSGSFSLVLEAVSIIDIEVRSEYWWTEGYKQVAQSKIFPMTSGRMLSISMEGTILVDSPPGNTPTYIKSRNIFFCSNKVNFLEYEVRRPPVVEDKQDAKNKKKRMSVAATKEAPIVDAHIEVQAFPYGTVTNGVDIADMDLNLTCPDLWQDGHLQMRSNGGMVLANIAKTLGKDKVLVESWWKVWLMLGYSDSELEHIKTRTDTGEVVTMMLNKCFQSNVNIMDRGVVLLTSVLDGLGMDTALRTLLTMLGEYKTSLINTDKHPPRFQLVFSNWLLRTKVSKNGILASLKGPQIYTPVSNKFLLSMSTFLMDQDFTEVGHLLDVEENVLYSINAEEYIVDPIYKHFRILTKSRQKKDEMVHYTLLLMGLVKQLEMPEAEDFIVTETRKWMATVENTELELCAKLENIFV